MVVPGGRIGALESSQSPFLGLQTLKSLVSPFLFFCDLFFFTPLSLLSFGMADGHGLAQVVGRAATTCLKGTWPRGRNSMVSVYLDIVYICNH